MFTCAPRTEQPTSPMRTAVGFAVVAVAASFASCGRQTQGGYRTESRGKVTSETPDVAVVRRVAREFSDSFVDRDPTRNCRLWHTVDRECVSSETATFRAGQRYRRPRDVRIGIRGDYATVTMRIDARPPRARRFRSTTLRLNLERFGSRWQVLLPGD